MMTDNFSHAIVNCRVMDDKDSFIASVGLAQAHPNE